MSFGELSQVLGNVGEFVGAIAVVATLFYLAVQVRQNTRIVRANIRQARSDSAVELHVAGATSQIAEIQAKELRGEPLDDVEERRLFLWYISVWRAQQTIFLQAKDDLLDEQTSSEQAIIVRTIMALESSRRWWADNKPGMDSRFTDWVDSQITAPQMNAR